MHKYQLTDKIKLICAFFVAFFNTRDLIYFSVWLGFILLMNDWKFRQIIRSQETQENPGTITAFKTMKKFHQKLPENYQVDSEKPENQEIEKPINLGR